MNLEKIQYEYDFHRNYNLKIKKETYVGKGLCGLVNLGAKCFMNSILQCLFHTLSLSDYFISGSYKEDLTNENKRKNEHYLLLSYLALVNNIWDTNQLIKPKSFVENLSKFHSKYFSMTQQDSHECLLYILEILHNSISYQIDIEIKGDALSDSDKLMKKSLESWQKFYEQSYSFIIETFNGSNITTIICNSCKNIEIIFEPFNTISVDLENEGIPCRTEVQLDKVPTTFLNSKVDLMSCLDNYFSNENVNTYNCEKCKQNSILNETKQCDLPTNANVFLDETEASLWSKNSGQGGCIKSSKLWTVPNYLIIHLKRFKQEGILIEKNNKFIDFPIKDLDITKFISKDKQDTNNYIYDLYAINQHSGSIESGHYWSSCKNLDNEWYNFNDNSISKYNKVNLNKSIINNDAYILFYQRKFVKNPIMI